LLFPTLVIVLTGFLDAWPAAESRAQAPTATPAIAGTWTLNKDLSDKGTADAREDSGREGGRRGGYGRGGGFGGGMRGGMGRGGGYGGAGVDREGMQRQRDAMRDLMNPPERLTIVQTETMVVITTGDGRVTRLSPDGKKIKDENTRIERKTKWDGGRLVSEISGLGGGKITETYAVDPERHQLTVTLVGDGDSRMSGRIAQRRVYDPADAR